MSRNCPRPSPYGHGVRGGIDHHPATPAIVEGVWLMQKSYALEFDGYWREPNVSGLLAKSGIYCVYACMHNTAEKTVSLKRLLYIGEAADVRDRAQSHDQWTKWRNQLKTGEELCVSAALISGESDRQRAEA